MGILLSRASETRLSICIPFLILVLAHWEVRRPAGQKTTLYSADNQLTN